MNNFLSLPFLQSETAPAYLTALAAVLISPIITFLITKLQITADTITKSRKEWIDTFRKDMAELLMIASRVFTESNMERREPENKEAYRENYYKFRALMYKTILSLNPRGTPTEKKLIRQISGLMEQIRYSEMINPELFHYDELDSIRILAQEVLKEEWTKVQRGEPVTLWKLFRGILNFFGLQYLIDGIKWIRGKFKKED